MFDSIDAIKEKNRNLGYYFFSRASMAIFQSRVETGVINGRYFITSEVYTDSRGTEFPRKFSIREATKSGKIHTVGHEQAHRTLEAAIAAVPGNEEQGDQEHADSGSVEGGKSGEVRQLPQGASGPRLLEDDR